MEHVIGMIDYNRRSERQTAKENNCCFLSLIKLLLVPFLPYSIPQQSSIPRLFSNKLHFAVHINAIGIVACSPILFFAQLFLHILHIN